MKATIGFLFFMLFIACFALVNLQARQADGSLSVSADSPLAENDWRPLRLFGSTVPGDFGIRMHFTHDGGLSGSGGCNRYSGRFESTGDTFRVASMRATRRDCDAQVMAMEGRLFDVFKDVRRTELADGELRFLDEKGEWLATFAPIEAESADNS